MADTNIKTQISRLNGAKSDLATAITAKGVTVPDTTTLDGYAALVEQIDTGVDTSDATATAKDIAKGKTAYVQGQKITGKLYEYTKGKTKNYFTTGSENVTFERDSNRDLINITIPWMGNDEIMRIDSYIKLGADATLFGDATAADVISGKTMTSAAGLKVVGTNTNDADTSDATATADDIAKGKTAYVQGQKITGKLYEYTKGKTKNYFTTGSENVTFERDSNRDLINITIPWMGNDEIMRIDSYIKLGADATLFGDATAADVISGKTMTSAAGLKVVGTNTNDADTSDATATADDIAKGKTAYVQGQKITGTVEPAESNNNVEAYAITNTNPSVSFKRTDGAIKIWGYGTMTSSSGWGGQTTSLIAFEGDKYHKSAMYGGPSSTSLSLSISNGKLTGLPSGLSAISAIVTRGI